MRHVYNLNIPHEQLFSGELAEQIPYHTMYGKPYCLPALTLYTAAEYEQIALASERVHKLYHKVLRFVQQYLPLNYLTDQLAIHPVLARIACSPVNWDGLTRLDWIIGPDGQLKCIENNTETPTGIPEVAYLESKLLEYAPHLRPASAQMNACIQQMFRNAVAAYRQHGLSGKLYMTSYDWHDEDRVNTLYLMEQCQLAGMEAAFVPLEQLRIVPGEGLYKDEERIELLYRLYPLEYLVEDREEESGRTVGLDLLELVEAGKLGLINPVQHIITQSKGFTATLWSLYERNDELVEHAGFRLFTPEECQWIEQYMLPTYFTPEPFIQTDTPYVSKSYFGREGQGTELVEQPQTTALVQQQEIASSLPNESKQTEQSDDLPDRFEQDQQKVSVPNPLLQEQTDVDWASLSPAEQEAYELEATAAYYNEQPKIYQQLQPMQPICAQTADDRYEGYLLTGAFVIGGRFAGLLPRIGSKVTDNLAYYCAAAVIPDAE
ncbi:glutathionylspermidine synthase family protein [Paenibacillus wenxiniae]|uniref:Glutathionylspermidine synthase family protein n=1 Tax=Paenibacillus wenxiniae TaxID=1636843 RepID=A0ABW4RLY3_9BACL